MPRVTVVISQGQTANPAKRKLEEDLVVALLGDSSIEVTVTPHLYDLAPDSTGMLCLSGIAGDMIVCSWLYPRAARWTLDRNGVRGGQGVTLIRAYGEDDDEDEEEPDEAAADESDADESEPTEVKQRVVDSREPPSRMIYCLDLRTHKSADIYVEEIRRIVREATVRTVQLGGLEFSGSPGKSDNGASNGSDGAERQTNATNGDAARRTPSASSPTSGNGASGLLPPLIAPLAAPPADGNGFATPSGPIKLTDASPSANGENDRSVGDGAVGEGANNGDGPDGRSFTSTTSQSGEGETNGPRVVDQKPTRRWYPVIDFSRCTNCMECIDFCLFGVYGLDGAETILVEQPDNCRKGCPACSRVCPENAIIFPQHKTPTIAGSPEVGGPMKIDLSQLFGAPDPGAPGADKALDVAVRERDEQLLLAGRETVGMEVGVPKRQADKPKSNQPKDELDRLMDELDEIDL